MKLHVSGFSAVLLLWLLVSSSVQEDAHKTGCLSTTDTKTPHTNLRSYTIQQKPLFPVHAVRFLTLKGITICSDPTSPWAIKAMKHLNGKKKQRQSNITIRPSVKVVHMDTSTTNMARVSAQLKKQT
nr:cytokine SCM-1 beta-like [Danio rerio]|eukprot:XP_005171406.1 cytokine SCM-1 beta-like [Danio rerio]